MDLTPCRIASFSVPSNPPELVFTRTTVTSSVMQNNVYPTYHNYFSNNWLSHCPILRYELLSTSGTTLSHAYVSIVNPNSPSTTRIDVKNYVAFTLQVRIQGYTMSLNNFMTLQIRVCGAESVILVNGATKTFIWGIETSLTDSIKYYSVPQSTFAAYF